MLVVVLDNWDVGRGSTSRATERLSLIIALVVRGVSNSPAGARLSAWRRPSSWSPVFVVISPGDPVPYGEEKCKRPCTFFFGGRRVSSSSSSWMPVRTVEGDWMSFMLLVRTPEVDRVLLICDFLDDAEDLDPVEAVDLKFEHICKHAKLKTITRLVGT